MSCAVKAYSQTLNHQRSPNYAISIREISMHKILVSEGGPRTNPVQDAKGQVYIVTTINICSFSCLFPFAVGI